jgi:hypothetical protein
MIPKPQTLVAYGIANGWIKKSEPVQADPFLDKRRTQVRECMRRARAKRYAQGLNAEGKKRVKEENVLVLCCNLERAWKEEGFE